LYFARYDQWVTDPSRALDLEEIEHPGQFAGEEGVTDLEAVLMSEEDPSWKLALPVRLARPRGEEERVAA
jgi:hypothetical protein